MKEIEAKPMLSFTEVRVMFSGLRDVQGVRSIGGPC